MNPYEKGPSIVNKAPFWVDLEKSESRLNLSKSVQKQRSLDESMIQKTIFRRNRNESVLAENSPENKLNYSKKELATLLNVVENDMRKQRVQFQEENEKKQTKIMEIEES